MNKIPYARTKAGRAMLRLKGQMDQWVKVNREVIPAEMVTAVQFWACELHSTAHSDGIVSPALKSYIVASFGAGQ